MLFTVIFSYMLVVTIRLLKMRIIMFVWLILFTWFLFHCNLEGVEEFLLMRIIMFVW